MSSEPTLYELLEVSESATADAIRAARKRLAKGVLNPYTVDDPEARAWREERLKEVNDAVDQLTDPQTRREYDDWLARERGAPSAAAASAPIGEDPVEEAPQPVDPREHVVEEPLPTALGKLLLRLLQAAIRGLPRALRQAPRWVLVVGGLLLAVVISSWAMRINSELTGSDDSSEVPLNGFTVGECEYRSGADERLPAGSEGAFDCERDDVKVTFAVTDRAPARRHARRRIRQVQKRTPVRRGKVGSCAEPGHVAQYRYRGELGTTLGIVFCWVEDDVTRFEWTDGTTYDLAESARPYDEVYHWWREQVAASETNPIIGSWEQVR